MPHGPQQKPILDKSLPRLPSSQHRHGVHWRTPFTMLTAFVTAAALALGHHFFYTSLIGKVVISSEYYHLGDFGVSQQQINTTAGTAFAFLFKVCLVISVSTAYTQLFWLAVRRSGIPLRTLDTLTTASDNILTLFKVTVWWKYPLLLLLALLIWLIPLASVISPATISVVVAPVVTWNVQQVPNADFTSLKFLAPLLDTGGEYNNYNGPTNMVQKVAQTVATSGSIAPIQAPASDSSWSYNFDGPYLKCTEPEASLVEEITKNIFTAWQNGSSCTDYFNFLAWTASVDQPPSRGGIEIPNSPLPFFNTTPYNAADPTPFTMNAGPVGPLNYMGNQTNGRSSPENTATIYVAVLPGYSYTTPAGCPDAQEGPVANATFLQCQLYNTTYQTEFVYVDGVQSIDVNFPNLDKAQHVETLASFYLSDGDGICTTVDQTPSCIVDPFTLQRLSYQAVMDAFGTVLVGSVHQGDLFKANTIVSSTSVLSTSLVYTPELNFLMGGETFAQAGVGLGVPLGSVYSQNASSVFESLYSWDIQSSNMSLKAGLEQLFQNITISMMSRSDFQSNASSPFAIPPVNVTIVKDTNVYAYAVHTLWLAYGLAIASSAVAIIIGLVAIRMNGATFSDEFSTNLRAVRNAEVSALIESDDDGRDPLPKDLKDATVRFHSVAAKHGDVEEITHVVNDGWKSWFWTRAMSNGSPTSKGFHMRLRAASGSGDEI